MPTDTRGKGFVSELFSEVSSLLPEDSVDREHLIPWSNKPRSLWPKADLLVAKPERWFIVEYDEDSDPGRSLTKYWPYIASSEGAPLTVIEIWRRGPTIGYGFAELAKWMGKQLEELYPLFHYEFIDRAHETAQVIAQKIVRIVEQP